MSDTRPAGSVIPWEKNRHPAGKKQARLKTKENNGLKLTLLHSL